MQTIVIFPVGPNGGLELVLDAQQYEYIYYYYKDNLGAGINCTTIHTFYKKTMILFSRFFMQQWLPLLFCKRCITFYYIYEG